MPRPARTGPLVPYKIRPGDSGLGHAVEVRGVSKRTGPRCGSLALVPRAACLPVTHHNHQARRAASHGRVSAGASDSEHCTPPPHDARQEASGWQGPRFFSFGPDRQGATMAVYLQAFGRQGGQGRRGAGGAGRRKVAPRAGARGAAKKSGAHF